MTRKIQTTPVAIIGLGAVMPDAHDLDTFWNNILSGRDSIREVPQERWLVEDHYDPDPKAPDKSYCKIGSWVSGFEFNPLSFRIPPKVAAAMDPVQKWVVESTRQALEDAGYAEKDFDRNRTAVIIGNALAGELQHITNHRVYFPRYLRQLRSTQAFGDLPAEAQQALVSQFETNFTQNIPPITEDSMPGELANCIAGRVANVFGLRGPNYTADAACASSLAALEAALAGLTAKRYDLVITGGSDSTMAPHCFVKFCKIGALSAEMSCPFDQRANGFVMGEGCGILLLKRLEDAERAGDKIYAVIRGMGSSSDGRGKGITAPNPAGQKLALERAYANAGVNPADISMLEAHGTSTTVGDAVEGNLACEFLKDAGAGQGSIAMGSVKSQIGHLKGAAGAAALLKTAKSIHEGIIPASLHFENPNPNIPFEGAPVYVPTERRSWEVAGGKPRTAGVSSFGFGGANFHVVLSEYRPENHKRYSAPSGGQESKTDKKVKTTMKTDSKILAVGGNNREEIKQALEEQLTRPREQDPVLPPAEVAGAAERLLISHANDKERTTRAQRTLKALQSDQAEAWRALSNQGIFRGRDQRAKIAFLFPGQGSQYINMLKDLREQEPLVAEAFELADSIMTPLLGRPLTSFIYTEDNDATREALKDTNVCQPAMLTADVAIARVLEKHGVVPDMVAGHSLGEYAALVVSGMLSFEEALHAVSARAREMSSVQVDDPGKMAAVLAPENKILELIEDIEGVAPANFNSRNQTVIGGGTKAVEEALRRMKAEGIRAVELQVSHAFHSHIVAPAVEPLRKMLDKFDFHPPRIPLVANVDARPYDDDPQAMQTNLDRLAKQIASPVRFVESLETMHRMGAHLFIEVGAKRVLANFVTDVLADPEVTSVCTNSPKLGDWPSIHNALAACAAAGKREPVVAAPAPEIRTPVSTDSDVVISGASLGLPGEDHPVFDEDNVDRILAGKTGIGPVPEEDRGRLAGQRVVRLVKDAPGGPVFEVLETPDEVVKLAGRKGPFNLSEEFGLDPKRVKSYDVTTQLAIAAGLLALKDAGIPLVMHHRDTTTGKKLPTGFKLPEPLADETGIIFASAFPGLDQLVGQMNQRHQDDLIDARIAELKKLAAAVGPLHAVKERLEALEQERGEGYNLDRKFIFRVLNFGHAQLAELIGARGPNTSINAACAATTQALTIASDWIRLGRCRRVLVVGADDITNQNLFPWLTGGMFATGAVTTESQLENAALPFDRRRNGMICGMGAVGLVVEETELCRQRGLTPLVRMLGSVVANSAHHGTRLNQDHIAGCMERLISQVEREHKLERSKLVKQTVFISHETYTPARGGSASAEIHSLRQTFGGGADEIVIANTKGYTGHPMGVGIEDAVSVRILERQTVPPIPNHREEDPDLGKLNLSKGGHHNVRYALRLAAGFGSQIAMTFTEKIADGGNRIADRAVNQAWLEKVSGITDAKLEVVNKTLRIKEAITTTDTISEPVPVPVPARVPETKSEPEAVPVPTTDTDSLKDKILAIVSEKTGYPADMLDLDLDLEADLGIDTVKQAEMFSEIRAAFGIPKQDDLKLSDYPTLNHVIKFAQDKMGTPPEPEPESEEKPAHAHAHAHADAHPQHNEGGKQRRANVDDVKDKILAIVSEKTGYPTDMLDLDLDLEADLGIDTVKQAEMFSEIRAAFGIPKQDDLKLSDYPTLNHVIKFAQDKMGTPPEPEAEAIPEVQPEPVPTPTSDIGSIKDKILAIVSEKTGYPTDMLDLDLDLEADLGIDTVKQAEMFSEIRAAFGIPKQDDLKLSDYPTLNHVIQFAQEKMGTPPEPEPEPDAEPVHVHDHDHDDVHAVKDKILAIVSEKTGYPTDMLDLDLDLEADLGIDTVKQAEMFSEIRAAFGIPKQDDLKLSDYPTLNHVIQFAQDKMRSAPVNEETDEATPAVEPLGSISAESETVRYLAPVLVGRPRARECLPTGVEPTGRSLIIGDFNGAAAALEKALRERGGDPVLISDSGEPDEVAERVEQVCQAGPPRGAWVLSALGDAVTPDSEDTAGFKSAIDQRARMPFRVAKVLNNQLQGGFFICATRMGGHLGLRPGGGSLDPASGATTGLVKALSREWTETLCKVVDFPEDVEAATIADTLIEEVERDKGICEVGRRGIRRWGVGLSEFNPQADESVQLPKDPVVLITGGAGDITGKIAADLAGNFGGTYYLADLVPAPAKDDPEVAALRQNRNGLKQMLIQLLKQQGERVTPVQVEKALRQVERKAVAARNLQEVSDRGGQAHSLAFDVTDTQAVEAAVQKITEAHGRIDLILHAAGLEHSQAIAKKTKESFDLIFGVKVFGLHALLRATRNTPVKGIMLFGSIAGRFGNAGQTDYSAANDLLSKTTTWLKRTRPDLQVFTLAFSGWDGVGMATRGSVPKQLAAVGINLIPLEEGAASVRRVFASGHSGELVVARSLGALAQTLKAPGVDLELIRKRLVEDHKRYPLLGNVLDWTLSDGLRLEVGFDPSRDRYLDDHRIDGLPVLPGVMAVETFAEAACLMRPDLSVVAVEDLSFDAPLKFYRDEPRSATVRMLPTWDGKGRLILATMETTRELHGGKQQITRHFCAKVRLDEGLPEVRLPPPGNGDSRRISREAIYRAYFHGPSFQVLDQVTANDEGKISGWMRSGTELPPLAKPGDLSAAPMFTELAFQAAGIVEASASKKLGLPAGVRKMKILRAPEGERGKITARVVPQNGNNDQRYNIQVVDERGFMLVELDGYRTSPLPNALPEDVRSGLELEEEDQ